VFAELTRREFFKKAGILGTALALSGCGGNRAEQRLVPFLTPPEEEVAGVFTSYASLCRMCPAGCGVLVKTMGGRAHKLEGNPQHPLNEGRLCARGQAGLQLLYNPDRLTGPQVRAGGRGSAFQSTTWDDGVKRLTEALKKASGAGKDRVAVYAGQLPDNQYLVAYVLLAALSGRLAPTGDTGRPPVVWNMQRACDGDVLLRNAMQSLWGERRLPFFDLAAADVVVSFSADLFETWLSPAYFGRSYGALRRAGETSRGYFVQVQSRLSLTGVSADEWYAPPPGREAEVAMVLGRVILDEGLAAAGRPAGVDDVFAGVDARNLAGDLGLRFESLQHLARNLAAAQAPLVIPGGGLGGYVNAQAAVDAVLALDLLVGADGKTLRLSPAVPDVAFESTERVSSFAQVQQLVADMASGAVDVLLVLDGDPAHDLPAALGFRVAAAKVPLIVDFASLPTDTGEELADLRLPAPTYLETWGYQVPQPGAAVAGVGAQQPVIRQVHDTRSPVDVLLAAGKAASEISAQITPWDTELALIKDRVGSLASLPGGSIESTDPAVFYEQWQQEGGWWSSRPEKAPGPARAPAPVALGPPTGQSGAAPGGRSFALHVYPSMFLAEGRGAALPWLQEAADTMTTVMWQSWVEVNPAVAADLGIVTGDLLKVTSSVGSVEVPAYVYFGIGPDMVAMPLGQGHTASGRYASKRGVNAADLLTVVTTDGTGELAWCATRVTLEKTGRSATLPRLEGSDSTVMPEGL
jgi:anaerobic selenocysteine-containing dehydrogenase